MGKESFKKSDNKNNIQFSKSAIVIDFIGRTIMETFRASGSWDYWLDTIQDFLCKLGMKLNMHLVKISIFSLNNVIVRPTKIIKDPCKAST